MTQQWKFLAGGLSLFLNFPSLYSSIVALQLQPYLPNVGENNTVLKKEVPPLIVQKSCSIHARLNTGSKQKLERNIEEDQVEAENDEIFFAAS